jgi:hypothetical protein
MSDSKIQIKVGIVEFSGEGNQEWLSSQLDKVLDKIPSLLAIEPINPVQGTALESARHEPKSPDVPRNLSVFLKDKGASAKQVEKFLATAAFLQLNGKSRSNSSEVSKALKDAHQTKLNNASDCLNQNVKK